MWLKERDVSEVLHVLCVNMPNALDVTVKLQPAHSTDVLVFRRELWYWQLLRTAGRVRVYGGWLTIACVSLQQKLGDEKSAHANLQQTLGDENRVYARVKQTLGDENRACANLQQTIGGEKTVCASLQQTLGGEKTVCASLQHLVMRK